MVSPRALWRPGTPDIETTGLWCHHIHHLISINLLGIPLKNIQMKLKMNAVPDYIWLLCLINNRTSTWIWEFKKPHHQQRAYECIRLPLSGPRSLATASQTVRQHWSTSALRTWHGAPHQQEIYGIYWFVLEPKQLLWIGPRWEELQNMTWLNRHSKWRDVCILCTPSSEGRSSTADLPHILLAPPTFEAGQVGFMWCLDCLGWPWSVLYIFRGDTVHSTENASALTWER